jgi:hypothetical protein
MDAVALAAVAVSSANLSNGFAVAALKAQVDAQRTMVSAIQQLTSSGPGQLVNMLV